MLKQDERWIFFYDKFLKPTPEDTPEEFEMDEVMADLYDRQQAGDSVKLINNETAAVRISDMRFDEDNEVVVLLLQYSDKNASDPAFSDLFSGRLRVEPKLAGEGIAISSHMVISLIPNEEGGSVYMTLLEDVPGIGRTKIQPFLTSEFKQACNYYFKDEEGRKRKCRPLSILDGHNSQQLREDLVRGVLGNIELVRQSEDQTEFDEAGYTREVSRNIQIKMSRPFVGEEALGVINRIKERARNSGYDNMKVRFKKPEGKQRSILIGTGREDAGDALYTRCELIKVREALPQCLDSIRDEVVEKMTSFITDARDN